MSDWQAFGELLNFLFTVVGGICALLFWGYIIKGWIKG